MYIIYLLTTWVIADLKLKKIFLVWVFLVQWVLQVGKGKDMDKYVCIILIGFKCYITMV